MNTENTFASVWNANADTSDQSANMRTRSVLMQQIASIVSEKQWTQVEAAKQCGLSQPRINDLLRGRVYRFSLDALVNIAAELGECVHFELKAEPALTKALESTSSSSGEMTTDEIHQWLSSMDEYAPIDASWTLQQIIFFDDKVCKRRPELRGKPNSPRGKWNTLHKLTQYEKAYSSGVSNALLLAIKKCLESELVVPDWASVEFVRKFDRVDTLEVTSWDDAFGRPYKKGMTVAARKKQEKLAPIVLQQVLDNYCSENPQPIDANFFEEIGKPLAISHSTAERYYRYARGKDWLADSLLPTSNRKKTIK